MATDQQRLTLTLDDAAEILQALSDAGDAGSHNAQRVYHLVQAQLLG